MKVTIVPTLRYEKDVKRLLTGSERLAAEVAIAADPELYPLVPGTGGVRKARFGRQSKGKSGGVRVIYYFHVGPRDVILFTVYAKNEKEDLSDAEKKALRKIVAAIKKAAPPGKR